VRSKHADALPLVMSHGWPGSVAEFQKVIEPLTDPTAHGGLAGDAFHVVCPSLPGYGFSGKPTEAGWSVERIARAFSVLMPRPAHAFGSSTVNKQVLAHFEHPPRCIEPFRDTARQRAFDRRLHQVVGIGRMTGHAPGEPAQLRQCLEHFGFAPSVEAALFGQRVNSRFYSQGME
jgi:pimeloyl-ACP methyl ester carboxylesterase